MLLKPSSSEIQCETLLQGFELLDGLIWLWPYVFNCSILGMFRSGSCIIWLQLRALYEASESFIPVRDQKVVTNNKLVYRFLSFNFRASETMLLLLLLFCYIVKEHACGIFLVWSETEIKRQISIALLLTQWFLVLSIWQALCLDGSGVFLGRLWGPGDYFCPPVNLGGCNLHLNPWFPIWPLKLQIAAGDFLIWGEGVKYLRGSRLKLLFLKRNWGKKTLFFPHSSISLGKTFFPWEMSWFSTGW